LEKCFKSSTFNLKNNNTRRVENHLINSHFTGEATEAKHRRQKRVSIRVEILVPIPRKPGSQRTSVSFPLPSPQSLLWTEWGKASLCIKKASILEQISRNHEPLALSTSHPCLLLLSVNPSHTECPNSGLWGWEENPGNTWIFVKLEKQSCSNKTKLDYIEKVD
jgi:hypothetical protein